MIRLRDVINIETAPGKVYDWFLHLEDNYLSWHPAHVSCKYLKGNPLEDGAVLYAEEYLHGRLHKLKFKLREAVPKREFTYQIYPGLGGAFKIRPTETGTEFTAQIDIGWSIPFLGTLLDRFLETAFSGHIESIRQHMKEEGVNLRTLLSNAANRADTVANRP